MRRYLRVLGLFWSTAVAAEMEYRINFLLAALSGLGGLAGSIFALFLFYRTGYQLGGWKWQEALLLLGIFTFLEGLSSTWLSPNLNRIVSHVQKGTLDFVLLKPIDSQFWLSTRNLSPWGLPNVVLGLVIMIYAGQILDLSWRAYVAGLVPLVLGMLILYSLWYLLACTSIWFVKIFNVTEVLRGLMEAGRFPIGAYSAGYRFFFTFIIPVAFLTTVPAQSMLGKAAAPWLTGAAVLAVALFLASRFLWRFALGHYTSASS